AVFLLAVFAPGCAQTQRAAMPASVCEIAAHPAKFNNRTVVIKASVRPTLHHQLVLTDAKCDRLIPIDAPERLSQSGQFQALMAAAYRGFPQDIGISNASGAFHGTLRYRASEVPSVWLDLHS